MDISQTVASLVGDGKISILKDMFEKSTKTKIDLNAVINGQTILLIAIESAQYELCKYLIEECKVDIEQTGTVSLNNESIQGASPLWLASATGNLQLVQLLVENGANVNATTKKRSSSLRAACYDGHLEVVKYLISKGADIELTNRHDHTCLMISAVQGHVDTVQYLVDCGADVNRQSNDGSTALHGCCETGSLEILKILLKNNAVMTEDSNKNTPLLTAAQNACKAIVHYIIDHDIDPITGRVDKRRSLCTELEKIHALELMGSTLVDKMRDMSNGIYYWRQGLLRRLANIKRILYWIDVTDGETIEMYEKQLAKPNVAYNYATEFNSLSELDQISSNVDDVRMQSLLIRERILGEMHPDTTYYIRFRGAVYADSNDYEMCIKLWLCALSKQQKSLDPLSLMTQSSLFSFAELFTYMMAMEEDLISFDDVFAVFQRALFELKSAFLLLSDRKTGSQNYELYKKQLVDCLDLNKFNDDFLENHELNERIEFNVNQMNGELENDIFDEFDETVIDDQNCRHKKDDRELIKFNRILILLQIFIGLLCRLKPSMNSDQIFRFKKAVYQLVKMNPKGRNNGFTLLHQASMFHESCEWIKFSIGDVPTNEIIELLIECGANVNALDNNLNTPLHIMTQHKPNNLAVKLLIDLGAHIDLRNKNGVSALDFLKNNPQFTSDNHIYPIRHLSLQCLCAQTILKNNLPYQTMLPKQMSEFVKIH